MKKPILIASASLDEHAYGPVRSILEQEGFPVTVYCTDRAIRDEDRFWLTISEEGTVEVEYDGCDISPGVIGAAWYRKLGNFFQDIPNDRAKQLYINNEFAHLHDTIWPLYPDEKWLNSPNHIRRADRKLWQLIVAREAGFAIPQTVVGSNWDDISSELLLHADSTMIVKTIRGIINEGERLKALYTTQLDQAKVNVVKSSSSPLPGIYQPFVGKAREWRITVVGEAIFPAAIYTDCSAKDDWRRLQATEAVQFKREDPPQDIHRKCAQYLGAMGLKFGAFDLIETPEGEVIFLECNPNGQYGWLEDSLELPISRAIADELIRIAMQA